VLLTDDESDEGSTDNRVEDTAGAVGTVLASLEASIGPVRPTDDVSGSWYDIEEGRYVEEPVPSSSCEQEGATSALVQDQL
jgi:hypothetical protein